MYALREAIDSGAAGPEWWQVMLQYGGLAALVAVISTVALIVQNQQNNVREDFRRANDAAEREKDRLELAKDRNEAATTAQAERDHQRQMAQIARDAQLAERQQANEHALALAARTEAAELRDRWRDERRAAHLKLLPIVEEAIGLIRKASQQVRYEDNVVVTTSPDNAISSLSHEIRERMTQANAEVQIIGSDQSRIAAARCREELETADLKIWVATISHGAEPYTKQQIRDFVSAAEGAIPKYVDAVRADLGTAG